MQCVKKCRYFDITYRFWIFFSEWWDLKNPDEKEDVIPEVWYGHNIADYVDPDILKKLEDLEKEEELREDAGIYDQEEVHLECCCIFHKLFQLKTISVHPWSSICLYSWSL